MKVVFIQDGDSIDYTPTVDVPAGTVVVQNDLVGVTKRHIPANTLGSLAVSGVFDFPKATATGSAVGAGFNMFWNTTTLIATTIGTFKLIGKTIKAATDADTTVRIRLNQ